MTAKDPQGLLPYDGPATEHRPNAKRRWYGRDNLKHATRYQELYGNAEVPARFRPDGDWVYSFNSLGFRGPEFDPAADIRIFTVGCSYTLGVGVSFVQSWPAIIARKLRNVIPNKSVSVVNFSIGAASNDYIARMALSQCARVKPDIMLIQFTHTMREEYIDERNVSEHFGPWSGSEHSDAFLFYYSEELGLVDSIKNMLLVDYYCRLHEIPLIYTFAEHRKLLEDRFLNNAICGPYMAMLDSPAFHRISILDQGIFIDSARDCAHPGPKSHELFARKIMAAYRAAWLGPGRNSDN